MSISPFEAAEEATIDVFPLVELTPDESGDMIVELLAAADTLSDAARTLGYLGNPGLSKRCRERAESCRRLAANAVGAH